MSSAHRMFIDTSPLLDDYHPPQRPSASSLRRTRSCWLATKRSSRSSEWWSGASRFCEEMGKPLVNILEHGSMPILIAFVRGMNIHFNPVLMWTKKGYLGFWPIPSKYGTHVLFKICWARDRHFTGIFRGIWIDQIFSQWKRIKGGWYWYPRVNVYITNWKDPPFSMGKSTINGHFQ